ncbi:hypothetical protein BC826DRAFT_1109765 [Russula brevipes]|nr:hypothetical protein BC826DRAFT_1109765 [Russula brevipes]
MARTPNRADLKPEGRALQARQVDLDGDEGAHSDSWPQPGTNIEGQDVYLRASALLEGEQKNLLAACNEQAVAPQTGDPARLPVNPYGMPNLGPPGAPAEADEGGRARAMADGAHPARSDPDVPSDPRGRRRALASTAVDSEAAGPHTTGRLASRLSAIATPAPTQHRRTRQSLQSCVMCRTERWWAPSAGLH